MASSPVRMTAPCSGSVTHRPSSVTTNATVLGICVLVIAVTSFEGVRVLLRKRRYTTGFVVCAPFLLLLTAAIVAEALSKKIYTSGEVVAYAGFFGFLLLLILRNAFSPVAKAAAGDQVLRGSTLVSADTMMTSIYGKKGAKQVSAIQKVIRIGEVVIPAPAESQHLLFSGTTGSGKTQGINRVLQVVRARGKRALVADASGGFVARFYQVGDLLFNPFDQRSVDWSPFAEVRAEYDCARIAKAAIPDGHGDGQEWHHYAQTLLGETMLALLKRDRRSIKQLLHYLTSADNKELGELLTGTPAAILCAKGNDKMLANTRGIISTYLVAWRYLADEGQFSVRSWIQDEAQVNWLFVTYRDDQLGMLRMLVATILELATIEGLSLSENPDRDLWFVMDEVDSLGKVSSLRSGLTKLRKYGCKVVLGLQTISQLRATYGHDEAQTLLANISTKAVLRAGDGETAEYFSKEFGDQEITRMQWSQTDGASQNSGIMAAGSASQSTSTTQIREHKRTILASEIVGLPDLCGFLKTPGAPIGYIELPYQHLPEVTPSYVESGIALLKSG